MCPDAAGDVKASHPTKKKTQTGTQTHTSTRGRGARKHGHCLKPKYTMLLPERAYGGRFG